MNPLLLLRLLISLKDYHQQINEEADEFDKKNGITAKSSKAVSHLVIGLKVVATAIILGEFPIDFLPDFGDFADKMGWLGVVGVVVFAVLGLLAFIAVEEKSERRIEVIRQQNDNEK